MPQSPLAETPSNRSLYDRITHEPKISKFEWEIVYCRKVSRSCYMEGPYNARIRTEELLRDSKTHRVSKSTILCTISMGYVLLDHSSLEPASPTTFRASTGNIEPRTARWITAVFLYCHRALIPVIAVLRSGLSSSPWPPS